jgi:hypothetical protein
MKRQIAQKSSDSVVEQLSTDFSELRKDISTLKIKIAPLLPLPFDSHIISTFPEIFAEFQWKEFSLLWRGSRDGFGSKEFHGRCDGHANTLTVILDTNGNIFGGFTPLEWESRRPNSWNDFSNCTKADDSLKSFLFTLKNPHNIPARRFALNAEEKHRAICCYSDSGPCFGACPSDLFVHSDCNANTGSFTWLGNTYINDTELDGRLVLTGSHWFREDGYFKVEEIEVFEISA